MNRIHVRIALLGLCLALFVATGTFASDAREGRPNVRAVTAFISLSAENYKQELADAARALNVAKKKYQQSGWEVQTIRITTQPFPEYVRGLPRAKALELLMELDRLAAGNYEFCIGPAMMKDADDPAMMDLAAEFLSHAKVTISSAIIAGDDGIHWKTIQQAAHLVKYVADNSPRGQGNFNFVLSGFLSHGRRREIRSRTGIRECCIARVVRDQGEAAANCRKAEQRTDAVRAGGGRRGSGFCEAERMGIYGAGPHTGATRECLDRGCNGSVHGPPGGRQRDAQHRFSDHDGGAFSAGEAGRICGTDAAGDGRRNIGQAMVAGQALD
jgi:hypothetical protein